MWFSPLKGAHLTLGQLDKTLPVNVAEGDNKDIERGSFVYIKATEGTGGAAGAARWAIYTATEASKPNAVPYIALMGVDDFQAGMAGNVGQAPEAQGIAKGTAANDAQKAFIGMSTVVPAVQGPRITAISVVQPAEYQTTAFKTGVTYYVGQPLTIEAGKLAPFASGKNIVGYVTAVPYKRWINDLGANAAAARISGGTAEVIEFSTAWIPVASQGAAGTDGAGTAPAALNVKPAAAPAPAAPAAKPATPAK